MTQKFGLKDKIGYMFGDFGNDFFFIFASSFLMVFYTKVLGIGAGAVGTLFLVARFIDAFTDISMGRLVDILLPAKDGKFRPWIRRMCIPVVIAGTLLFVPWIASLPYGARLVYIYITYILWGSICYTAINIPYGSMASALTSNPLERSALSTFRSVGAALANIIVSVGVPLIVYQYDASGNQVVIPQRFFIIACVFAVAALICYILCYKLTNERVVISSEKKEKVGFAKTVTALARNKSLLAIIGAAIVLLLSMLLAQSMNTYLFMDYFKNKSAMSVAGFFNAAATLVLAPFSTKIIKRFGKKEASSIAVLFAAVMYFIMFFVRFTNPWIFCVFIALGNLGTGLFNLMIWAFITDIIDYQEVRSGSRDDGTVYAVYSFARKIGQALAGGLGGWTLAAIGYQSSVGGETVVQTTSVVNNIYSVATLAPAVCYLIVGLILLFWYPLTKKKVLENSRILEERRSQNTNA
ncbi:MFS transporter [Robinsoniella peoriensis]|uniref:MFS transporter n=1 Tax=Robinsoniella peoriensis TaxID=180332 RepID=UPI0005C7D1B3|nr:glycoside-pentoside-hexuronide (GPH):cation symporter [Robinsoniella peoriensis]